MVDYCSLQGNLTVNLKDGDGGNAWHEESPIDWTVELVETGPARMTGGRIKRLVRTWVGRHLC